MRKVALRRDRTGTSCVVDQDATLVAIESNSDLEILDFDIQYNYIFFSLIKIYKSVLT